MTVTIYGSTNCAFCKVEKEWLDSKGISYSYRNIDEDEAAKQFIEDRGLRGVPVTLIDGITVQGFNRPALTKALNL